MSKPIAAIAALLSVMATAQAEATPPAVETMTCDQMREELIAAGTKMKSQLDPEFEKEAKAMMAEAQAGPSAGEMATGFGMSVACSIPGVDMFCMAAQYGQAMAKGAQAEQNIERMQAQMERLERAMAGLDMSRLEALSQRFEAQKCEVPQQ